jgi:hypothetical protein
MELNIANNFERRVKSNYFGRIISSLDEIRKTTDAILVILNATGREFKEKIESHLKTTSNPWRSKTIEYFIL